MKMGLHTASHVMYCVLLTLCFLVPAARPQVPNNCTFPPALYKIDDDPSDHTWRFLSPDPTYSKPHTTGQWSIRKRSAYVSHGTSINDYDSADGYDLECIKNVGGDKVLVKRLNVDGTNQFTCIQFVKRSDIVFQVPMAEYVDAEDAMLCEDSKLKNNDITLVHFHPVTWKKALSRVPYMSCGLDGGYMISQWYDEKKEPGCVADVTNALRIEDDCDRGSGLHIIGDNQKCPSPLQDFNKESLICIAKWNDGTYDYSIATDEWNSLFVCLRILKKRGKQFDIEIFLDGICDSTADISHSTSYRRLSLQQVAVPDLCADTSPHCTVLGHTQCTGLVPDLCRKTCSVCPKEKPWLKTNLPKSMQEQWLMETSPKSTTKVTITNRAIQYPNHITWRYFGPSPCNRTRVGHQRTAEEYLMVSTSTNGCLPRVVTAMVNHFSQSVIGIEISKSWPSELKVVNNTAVWSNDMSSMCDKVQYLSDSQRLGDTFHTSSFGWRNLIKNEDSVRLSRCNLFTHEKLDIFFNSGDMCFASIELKPLKDSFDMMVEQCGKNNKTSVSIPGGIGQQVRYECMASFKDAQGLGQYIITKTTGPVNSIVNETYLCWYLGENRQGYLLPVSDCNDMTPSRIALDIKQPLASVTFARVTTVSDPTAGGQGLRSSCLILLMVFMLSLLTVLV